MNFEYGNRNVPPEPAEINKRLAKIGGLNRFNEPNFRLVWGGTRLHWIGGRFENEGFVGTTREPKYSSAMDEWHLEAWQAPEAYGSKESWNQKYTVCLDGAWIDIMGPFPSRGDYESVTSFPPVPLNTTVCDALVRLVERSRVLTRSERKLSVTSGLDKKEKDWDSWADDVLDDAFPAFGTRPHVAGFHSVKEKNV